MATQKRRLTSTFTIGGHQAESDPLLDVAFYPSDEFEAISSRDDRRCFLIGRTGAGKSAVLQRLEDTHAEHVIRINPEDLSLPYITNNQALQYLESLNVQLDNFWSALWKHVLIVEIIRHRYNVNSAAAKENFMQSLRAKIRKDPAKRLALDYLDEFEGRFWCEVDDRVKQITETFSEKVVKEANGNLNMPPASVGGQRESTIESSTSITREQVNNYQRIVNETQLPRLNKMIAVTNEDILTSEQDFTYIIIDDLDRDWVDATLVNDLIRCLFRAVLDLQRVRNLKVLVALRTNLFAELDFGKLGAGQEEKYRSLILPIAWTRSSLSNLLDQRIRVASKEILGNELTLASVLPNTNKNREDPTEYLVGRTLLRPRDAIAYVNECFRVSAGRQTLSWDTIKKAEYEYSRDRLLALRDEWKTTYLGIDQIIECFRGAGSMMDRDEFTRRLDECALLLADPGFPGTVWLTGATLQVFQGSGSDWVEERQPIISILYKVGLIGIGRLSSRHIIYFNDEERAAEDRTFLRQSSAYSIHPTFHRGLDVVLQGVSRKG